ncbi:MAG TPA: NAD(P)-dependent oxidoreductase [Thermoanaerobaculia bacterium]|nr:NAD(P)-dependent oxidoreductase [Thermoanaerobaculia bacterium]
MKNVFIAAPVERALIERLKADAQFTIVDRIEDAHVLITRTINDVSREMLAKAPHLELVAQGTSGIDNIDVEALAERGIPLVHLPGINANAVAEMVIGQIIMLTRTLPLYTRQMLQGTWNRDDCATRHEMRHYVLGVVGHGNVGSRVARLARAFGMRTIALDPYVSDLGDTERTTSLSELLTIADVLTLHVPLTPETRRMIASPEIAAMKPGAILINAARGEVLDLDAAFAALASKHLGGLAVDVFEVEPPNRTWPDDPRLILTPHIGGGTHEAKSTAAELLYRKITGFFQFRPIDSETS